MHKRLPHGYHPALFGFLLCSTLLAGGAIQEPAQDPVKRTEILSYEGQKVSSVELAGQPDANLDALMSLVKQRGGEGFSSAKIDQSIAALQQTGQFKDVQLDLRPEQEGVRVIFILQPAVYFGMYQFPGAEEFPYARLLQASAYSPQEPYSTADLKNAQESLLKFLRRNGYFEAEVKPEVQVDKTKKLANINFGIKLNRLAKFGDISINGPPPAATERFKGILRSLRARMKSSAVREGKDYSLKTLQNATAYLEGRLQSENRLEAQVKLIGANYNPQTNRADVSFDINLGPVVQAQVIGAHLWPWTKRRLLPIYQQGGVGPEIIQEGRQNLLKEFRKNGYFDVQVATETQEKPDGLSIIYRITQGQQKKIDDVAFTGNSHFGEDELVQHVTVEKASFLTRGTYNESSIKSLQAFYQSKGFNQVKVTPQIKAKGSDVIVTFVVDEGPQDTVESFRVDGNNSMALNRIAPDGLRLAPGQPYAQKAVDDDRNKIMSNYLEAGYLTATFHATAKPSPNDPHKFQVVYDIHEGPEVKASNIVTLGRQVSQQGLIDIRTRTLRPGGTLTEREILTSESRLYSAGVFDWAEVNTRRQITSQEQEEVIVKVHESKRNTITYGFGFEFVNRGGSVPSGTVALPGLPAVGLPSTFKTDQQSFSGPRVSFQYTRNNVLGKAETITVGSLYGPLDRKVSFVVSDPNFRWTNWSASLNATGEYNKENPIFTTRQGQAGFQLQRALDAKRTQNVFLRYTMTQTRLSNLLIPDLVPAEDVHTRLSTVAGVYIRDTRDNTLDAHKGLYDSVELDVNPRLFGSNVGFGKFLGQAAYYKPLGGVVWANSLRLGMLHAFSGNHIPISQEFFSGGGSTLRGFALNAAGPQRTVAVCSSPADTSTCSPIRVPTGGNELVILNSEFRIPLALPFAPPPFGFLKKGLSLATFYDGGNVFQKVGFSDFRQNYTNSVGLGLRYATPVGPIRVDLGHNLKPIPGLKGTQFFITLGQAF